MSAFTPDELERGRTVPALKSAVADFPTHCWDHNLLEPCPKCAADAAFEARMADMNRWLHLATLTDQLVVNNAKDQGSLSDWSAYCRKRAAKLNGELMAEANAEEML